MNEREIMSLAVTFGVGILILSQVTVVDANPFRVGSSGIFIFSPSSSVYLTPNVDICFVCNMRNNLTRVNSFSFSLDKGANSTLAFKVSESDIYAKGIKYSVSKTLENLADGDHALSVFAHFSNGTVNSIFNTRITVDTTLNPCVISPLNQTTYNCTEVQLIYTVNELLWSYCSLDGSDWRYFDGNVTLPWLSEGLHELRLAVSNNISRTNPTYQQTTQTINTIIFSIDTVAPKIADVSVDSTCISDFLLNFSVSEKTSWAGYSLDNRANITINGDTVLRDLSTGVHNVTVYAKDSVGNIGVSDTISFIAGLFSIIIDVLIAIVIIVSVGLLVYFKRKKS